MKMHCSYIFLMYVLGIQVYPSLYNMTTLLEGDSEHFIV